jgi:hypothetical protein
MIESVGVCVLQAMDRAHRIGQDKPVLVLRLAAANSVDGRMLKRANSKLMLERLVIRKGAFMASEADTKATSLSNDELMELLKDTIPLKDEPQSDVVSDKVRHLHALAFLLGRLRITGFCLHPAWPNKLLILLGRWESIAPAVPSNYWGIPVSSDQKRMSLFIPRRTLARVSQTCCGKS